jgi:hypothetical protein
MTSLRASLLTLGLIWLVALPAHAGDTLSPKQATKEIGKQANAAAKQYKKDLATAFKNFCTQLKSIQEGVTEGSLPLEDLAGQLANVIDNFHEATMTAQDQAATTIGEAHTSLVPSVDPFDPIGSFVGFLAADCGALDVLELKMELADAQFRKKLLKKVKKLEKTLKKKSDAGEMLVGIDSPDVALDTPGNVAPNPEPPAQLKPTKVDTKVSGTPPGELGKLCLGGQGDPANGASVTVTITLPDGTTQAQTVPVEEDCRWSACFGGDFGQPGSLPPGNYTIEVDHGGHVVTDALGVPAGGS